LQVTAAQSGFDIRGIFRRISFTSSTIASRFGLTDFCRWYTDRDGVFVVDCIEIFPTKTPVNLSSARISHANNPESFDDFLT